MSSPQTVNDLTPDEFFQLVKNATVHAMAEQSQALAEQTVAEQKMLQQQTEALLGIRKYGVKVSGGVAAGVFWGLFLWTVVPIIIMAGLLMMGGLAALAG